MRTGRQGLRCTAVRRWRHKRSTVASEMWPRNPHVRVSPGCARQQTRAAGYKSQENWTGTPTDSECLYFAKFGRVDASSHTELAAYVESLYEAHPTARHVSHRNYKFPLTILLTSLTQ